MNPLLLIAIGGAALWFLMPRQTTQPGTTPGTTTPTTTPTNLPSNTTGGTTTTPGATTTPGGSNVPSIGGTIGTVVGGITSPSTVPGWLTTVTVVAPFVALAYYWSASDDAQMRALRTQIYALGFPPITDEFVHFADGTQIKNVLPGGGPVGYGDPSLLVGRSYYGNPIDVLTRELDWLTGRQVAAQDDKQRHVDIIMAIWLQRPNDAPPVLVDGGGSVTIDPNENLGIAQGPQPPFEYQPEPVYNEPLQWLEIPTV